MSLVDETVEGRLSPQLHSVEVYGEDDAVLGGVVHVVCFDMFVVDYIIRKILIIGVLESTY